MSKPGEQREPQSGDRESEQPGTPNPEVQKRLDAMCFGDQRAAKELIELLYQELHRIARAVLAGQRPSHTLQATALVNEAWLKLIGSATQNHDPRTWNSQEHFLAAAAVAMRHVLIDYEKRRPERGRQKISLEDVRLRARLSFGHPGLDILAIDEALTRLAEIDSRQARVVELRLFGGLTQDQIGVALAVDARTVRRDWNLAKAWLEVALEGYGDGRPGRKKG